MEKPLTLETLELYLQTVLEHIQEAVWVVDKSYQIIWCNQRFTQAVADLFGYDLQQGKSALGLGDNEEERAFWRARYEACFAGKTIHELDTYIQPDLVANVRLSPIYAGKGVEAVLCSSVNVKQDKDKDLALFYSQRQASETQRKQTELLARISHELRTPLNGIMGIAHLLLHESPKPEQVEHLRKILHITEGLATITQKTLDFIDIAENTFVRQEKPFSVRSVLQATVQMFQPLALDRGINLQLEVAADVPDGLVGDNIRITQILEQLLTNAFSFTEQGTIKLAVGLLPQELPELLMVEFKVQDSGVGIAPNKLTHLFEMLHATQEYKPAEKVLGLPLVKHLLEKLGGKIEVRSKLGRGTTFICQVPLRVAEAQGKAIEVGKMPQLEPLAGLRVLYAEDNLLNQRWTGKFLQHWHIAIDYAANGRQAIEKVRNCAPEHFYHIILMDLQMPEVDGFAAAEAIREITDIPIIALTALTLRAAKKRAFAVGMNDYIAKPFAPELLYNKLQEHSAYEQFIYSEDLQRKMLADFDAVVRFADGDLVYEQEMFALSIRFVQDFAPQYEEVLTAQDLPRLKAMEHKSRPSIRLFRFDCLEQELRASIEALEKQNLSQNQRKRSIQIVRRYCALCLAHLKIYSSFAP